LVIGNGLEAKISLGEQNFLSVKIKDFVKLLTICNFKEKNVHWANLMVDRFKKSYYFRKLLYNPNVS